MDKVKEAFAKIKEDISSLKNELSDLRNQLFFIQNSISELSDAGLKEKDFFQTYTNDSTNHQTDNPTHLPTQNPTNFIEFGSFSNQQTDQQTQNLPFKPLKDQNLGISIGNRGVPTDKQTNQQTNQQTQNLLINKPFSQNQDENKSDFQRANEIISSLDGLKKDIRLKFKRLTPQEMTVFSAIYSLDDEKKGEITYRTIANMLNLSESSIRDYVNKLINKGIPVDKLKQNNKTILLTISPDLKNIASLATIQNLRDL